MGGYEKKIVAEFFGTFGLIFMGAGAIMMNEYTRGALGLLGIAVAHGLAISLGVAVTAHISGGHLNPAVTAGFLVTRRMDGKTGVVYVIAQLAGAWVAALFLRALFPPDAAAKSNLGTPALAPGVPFVSGIVIEIILTFFLVLVIFGTAVDPRGPKAIFPFCIGMTVAMDILAGGPLTGASMNPARTLGPALAYWFWDGHLVYWVGPIVGGILGALLYDGVLMEK